MKLRQYLDNFYRELLLFWGVFLISTLCASSLAREPSDGEWFTLSTPHFNVHHQAEQKLFAQTLAGYLEEAHQFYSGVFHEVPDTKTPVVVSFRTDDFNGFAQVFPYSRSVIFIANPNALSVVGETDNWIRTVAFHEYFHIVQLRIQGGVFKWLGMFWGNLFRPAQYLPRWLIEGSATWAETRTGKIGRGRSRYMEMIIRKGVEDKQIRSKSPRNLDDISLDRLSLGPIYWPSGVTPYLWGYLFFEELIQRSGNQKSPERVMGAWAKKAGRYVPFFVESAIKSATHEEIVPVWRSLVKRLYKTYRPILKKIKSKRLSKPRWQSESGGHSQAPLPVEYHSDGKLKTALGVADHREQGASLMRYDFSPSGEVTTVWMMTLDSAGTQMTKIPGTHRVLLSQILKTNEWQAISDLFEVDYISHEIWQITEGAHLVEPAVSTDGKNLVALQYQVDGNQILMKCPLAAPGDSSDPHKIEIQECSPFYRAKNFTRISQPTFGRGKYRDWIFFSLRNLKGQEYIFAKSLKGKLKRVTGRVVLGKNDFFRESYPRFSFDGGILSYEADYDGINQIYECTLGSGFPCRRLKRVTRTTGGNYEPEPLKNGGYFSLNYESTGFHFAHFSKNSLIDEKSISINRIPIPKTTAEKLFNHPPKEDFDKTTTILSATKRVKEGEVSEYFSLTEAWPQWWFGLATWNSEGDGSLDFFASTGGNDPLDRHSYSLAFGAFQNRYNFKLNYEYSKWEPTIVFDYAAGEAFKCKLPNLGHGFQCSFLSLLYPMNRWFLIAGGGVVKYPTRKKLVFGEDWSKDFIFGFGYKKVNAGRLAIAPQRGGKFETLFHYFPEQRFEPRGVTTVNTAELYLPGPFFGDGFKFHGSFAMALKSESQLRDETSRARFSFTKNDPFAIRGYREDPFFGRWFGKFGLDYTFQLTRFERGFVTLPLYARYLALTPFLEGGGQEIKEWIALPNTLFGPPGPN